MANNAASWILANRYSWIDQPGIARTVDEAYGSVRDIIDEAFLGLMEALDLAIDRYSPFGMGMHQHVADDVIVIRVHGMPLSGVGTFIAQRVEDLGDHLFEIEGDIEYSSPAPGQAIIVIHFPPGTMAKQRAERLIGEAQGYSDQTMDDEFGSAGPWIYAHRYAWSSGPPRNR